ncbi:MAG: response regulator [Carbonactinosporaceae bacterium]
MAGDLGRVLVVDDSEVIRRLITVNLELEGFEVFTATDGLECVERALELLPGIVTLDVIMPRLDGFRAATRLREHPWAAGMKIIMVTAAAQTSDLQRGRDIGVDGYLTKPFDPAQLIRMVRALAGVPSS